VNRRDPAAYASATVVLFVVTPLATYIPARRASQVDPLSALQAD
jgi:ABC-type lipoprotein release transport system permease subunit